MAGIEWSEFSGVCECCGRTFRLCADTVQFYNETSFQPLDQSEVSAMFPECWQCSFGEALPGEYVPASK